MSFPHNKPHDLAGSESAAREAELERQARRYSQLHPEDEPKADAFPRKTLRSLLRIFGSQR